MDFHKINFLFYLSHWWRLLLIAGGDVELNHVRVLTGGFWSSIPIFVVFEHGNLDKSTTAKWDYDSLVCAESKVRSELRIPGFGCPQQRLRNSTPGARGLALYVREGTASWSVPAMSLACFVFAVG